MLCSWCAWRFGGWNSVVEQAGSEEVVDDGLGIHVGKFGSSQVGKQGLAEGFQLLMPWGMVVFSSQRGSDSGTYLAGAMGELLG